MEESVDCSAVRELILRKNVIPQQIVQDKPKETKETTSLSPSEYVKCMTTNPEAIILENYEKRESTLFTPDPKIIVFKNFEPGEIHCITLTIQNTSPIPHYLRLVYLENVSFVVTFTGSTLNTRLAAGMSHVYEVQFRPDEKRDYRYDIEFETEIESFVIPVLAVGPRALLSLPDEVDVGRTAVKVAQVKSIMMRNSGDAPTGFSIYTDNPCFTVNTAKGFLKIRETRQLLINFLPMKSGFSSARMFVRYDEGDTVQSLIYGEAVECDVRVIENNIVLEDTYFGLSRLTFIEIQNNSEFLLDYEWVKYPSEEEDLREKDKKLLDMASDSASDTESIPPEGKELIKQRKNSDKTELLMQESLPFDEDDFRIFPLKLQVRSRSTTKVTLTFQPTRVGDIQSFAFLDIGGLENRICVSLKGKCLGPALRLNVLSLDVQRVCLCSAYNYEIVCENFGPIPGTLAFVRKNADFGSTIRVEPNEMKVDIGELKPMNLRFCSDRSGEFVERVDFVIKESSDLLSFVLKGRVICPLKKICKNKLNFESASVGFTSKAKVWIKNMSHERMQFNLEFPSDGYETAFSYVDFSRAVTKPTLPECPREFDAEPSEGIIEPESARCIEVCYTPNIARSGDMQLLVNACKSPSARPLEIPLKFHAKSAAFEVTPAEIYVRFCFVNFPYCRTLTIINTSDAHGYFYFVPQEVSDNDEVVYSLSTYQGHLEPGHCAEIALTVIVQEIGEHTVDLKLFGLGFETPIKCCEITCHGKGPVVTVEPSQLNWGEIRVLEKQSFDLTLTNDSPISAKVNATANKHKSIWNAEPCSIDLNPNESITLKVHAFLRDTGKFTDRLSITIFNGQTINVGLSAIGVGCCIVFQPEIFPAFNMGYQFSRQDVCIPIIVKNEGTKSHHLLLTNVEKPKQAKKAPVEENKSLFKIEPNILEALPGSTHTIYCKIRWNANEVVEEQWYLHATIEAQSKRELLGTSMFSAVFMEPDISFDKAELTFRLDFGHDRENIQQKDEIIVTNRSGRDLGAHVTIDFPFRIINKCNCCTDYVEATLRNDEPVVLRVFFPYSTSCTEPLPTKFEGYLRLEYNEHKQIDKIPCTAEVNYPHLVFIPDVVRLYCPTGKIVEEQVKFVNDTPLAVIYKIEWLRDAFSCRSLPSTSEGGSEGSRANDADRSETDSSQKISELDTFREKSRSFADMYEGAEDILSEISSLDLIDKFLQISPMEGHILPHSEVYVTFTFNGFQRTRLSAQAVCHIERGSTKILSVHAVADDVKCELQNDILDFGLGLFCEPSLATLVVCNRCAIPLAWTIDSSSECLTVIDAPSVLAPDADSKIRVERSPTPPGIFSEKMILDVAYLEPFLIDVKWLSTIPQVYFDAPRAREFEKYPADLGYEAVRMIVSEGAKQDDKFVETMCLSSSSENDEAAEEEEEGEKEFTDFELTQLIDDGWHIVSNNENYPSRIDIDMAFERHLARNYVDPTIVLHAPAYSIDVGFVVVEQTSQLSVPLKNYGYERAKVTLKLSAKVRKPTETCFYVELEKNTEICQCESTFLNVTFRPKKKIFTQKRTDASYRFHLEVRYGLTIPVSVKAAAVYPHVSVNVENFDFEKVFVGECRRMSFVLRNDGFVDCHWMMSLTNASDAPKKSEGDPFYVGRANDMFVPGQEETLYIYFTPLQNGIQKFNLTIAVLNGYETKTISLIGCGVERRISISRTMIKCTPVIPNVSVTEKYFNVKNPNSYPIELYWDHLTDFSQSNRIVRLLKHYYDSCEILIPQRKIGDTMPSLFQDFYDELIRQMCTDQEYKPFVEEWLRLEHVLSDRSMNSSEKNGTSKKSDVKKSKGRQSAEKDESEKLTAAIATTHPDKVEFLLDEYICRLKERPNYLEANDPLNELYRRADEEIRADLINKETEAPEKNLIVIFYGPSFTEPQETACRVAKSLNLPLLNLNQIFLEAVASSQTESAKKFADQLDSRYKELTTKLEKLKAVLSKKNANNANELLKLSQKIPSKEVLDDMEAYDRCELKLEIITSIMNFLESSEAFGPPSVKDKASVKSQDVVSKRQSALLSVGRDTYQNVLRESLASSRFDKGYVLQTLNNDFLRNEATVMKMLLEASGNVKMRFLITFYGQPGSFEDDDCESNDDEEEEACNKNSEVFSKVLAEYQNGLTKLVDTISNWEHGYAEPNKSVKGNRKSEVTLNSFINPPESFSIWHVKASKTKHVYDAMIQQLQSVAFYLEDKKEPSLYVPESKTFSILREYKNELKPADNFSLSTSDENEDQPLQAHWTLQPRESQKFKINFQASKQGRYDSAFFLTLLDNPAATFKIGVEGVADVPRLDFAPIAIFNAIKDAKINEVHEPCYFLDNQVYDFGCLLVLNDNKLHKRSTQFKFKNISAVPVNVSFSLTSDSYDCFNICPRKTEIKPTETVEVEITACSLSIGSNKDTLTAIIENNDQPLHINLESTGIELQVEIDPTHVNLGRILLGRIEKHAMTIRNRSAVAIYWRLSCDPGISVVPPTGKIRPRGHCDIELRYFASKVGVDKKFVEVAWCLVDDNNDPIAIDNIDLFAETYEILHDVALEDPIDLGSVPVGTTANKSFAVKNVGPYEFEFCISRPEESISKRGIELDFQCYPPAGLVLPKKQIDVTVSYTPTVEFKMEAANLFNLDIIEPYKNIGTVGTFGIKVSAISFFTKFVIEPSSHINFATVALNSTKSMQFKIRNTGKFPLVYTIASQPSPNKLQAEAVQRDSISKKARKSLQSEKVTAKRLNSMANFRLKCGPFTLDKFKGELDVDQIDDISVQCTPDAIGDYEEKLSVTVQNSKETREINLLANVRVAEIDFQDHETIFGGSHIVATSEQMELLNEPEPHTVFAIAEQCLHFRQVCVGSEHVATVTLRNISLIDGDVSIELPDENFKIDTNRLNIPAASRRIFSVAFAPYRIDNFASSLKITLDLPPTLEAQSLSIDLAGEGYVPQISILEPTADECGDLTLNFGLSYVCEWREKMIKIQNVGKIRANVIVETSENPEGDCNVRDDNENRLICGCVGEDNDADARRSIFPIEPCEIQLIKIHFFPVKTGKYDNCLRIFVEENPYEVFQVKVGGEGFCKPVVLENLELMDNPPVPVSRKPSKQKSRKSVTLSSSSKSLYPAPLTYELDYGRCFLRKAHKINFKITNKTTDRHYRFEWASCQHVTCSPVAGHVMPDGFKEITATFHACEPTTLTHMPLECTVHEILLTEPTISSSWDARQTEVQWTENSPSLYESCILDEQEFYYKKLVKASSEPDYSIVPDTLSTMQLSVSAIADYSDYDCFVKYIDFDDTLMFQTREHRFTLENPGAVNLNYAWELTMDECYPIRLDQSTLQSSNGSEGKPPPNSPTPFRHAVQFSPDPPARSEKSSDLFSSSAGMSDRSTDSWIEGENWPFEIVPEAGSVAPGEKVECTLKFKPVDVFKYKAYLWCKMENLNPSSVPLNIVVVARSLLPYCHFEIEPSDYLAKRDVHLPMPMGYNVADLDTAKVVEYRMIGVDECHTRCLYLINPTTEDYSYRWSRLAIEEENPLAMQCSQERGLAERGKRTRMTFTFKPTDLGSFESFWMFEIEKHDLTTLFLIAANVCEPVVSCKNALLKLPPATICEIRTASFEIANNECCSLKFWLDENSLFSDGRLQKICVCPTSGVLEPNASQVFCVGYEASVVGEHNFRILCNVEKLKRPVRVSVVAQVKEVLSTVVYVDSEGLERKLHEACDNLIDLKLLLNTPTKLQFKIDNSGEIAFNYRWTLSTLNQDKFDVLPSESEGTVEPNSQAICYLDITAKQKVNICNYDVKLQIASGPTYRIKLNSETQKPALEFSFKHYDFGPCYIFERGTSKLNTVDLLITNHQKIPCVVKCKNKDSANLSLNLDEIKRAIAPNDTARVVVNFTPHSESLYEETLTFSSTGERAVQNIVTIRGEGVAYKIRLKNACDAIVDFGNVKLGKSLSRKIVVVNAGRLPVALKPIVRGAADFVKISSNARGSVLKPQRELTVTIALKAICRRKALKSEIGFEMDGAATETVLLTTVKANCIGADIRLNRTCVSFGTVYEGCAAEERLILANDGDVGSRFRWVVDGTTSFSISPTCGFSSPGSEIAFVCGYEASSSSQTEAILELEELASLSVGLSASTCRLPEPREVLDFKTEIQRAQTREVSVFNDSSQRWNLKPRISGECFTSAAAISVDPKTTEIYAITYNPKKLTMQEAFDEGKLIIPLPDGRQPLVYSLQGRCTPAVISQKIVRTVPCKKKHIENLLVYNNTDRPRTFDSVVERDNKKIDSEIPKVHVPANSSKRCKLPLYFESEGNFFYKVTFFDHEENYQYFEIDYSVSGPETKGSIELATFVRAYAFSSVKISNPSKDEVATFEGICHSPDVVLHGLPTSLKPLAFKNVRIEYFPLIPSDDEATATLEIASSALGSVFYELRLTAKPAVPEKTVCAKACLGSSSSFSLPIKNYSKDLAKFTVESGEESFTCERTIEVAASDQSSLKVNFEPHSLESINSTIVVTSDTAGEFVFPIVGQCTPPRPQGPFLVSPQAPASIIFKNVFLEPSPFELVVDNPIFTVESARLYIKSKESIAIVVKMLVNDDVECKGKIETGKLVVVASSDVKWTYYLRGECRQP